MHERTIISDGASKTWAMTGWRIGFTSNPALAPVFTRWITNTESCASQISQWAAVEAINGPQDAAEAMQQSFLERRDLIVGLLNEVPGVKCQMPGGAFYVWPNVTEACRMIGARGLRGVPQAPAERGRRRGARRHPLRRARAGRRPARALLVRRLEAGDRGGRAAHGRLHPEEHAESSMSDLEARRRRSPPSSSATAASFSSRSASTAGWCSTSPPATSIRASRWSRRAGAKCSRKRRTASSRRALVGIYRWHYAPKDVTFLRFCFRGRIEGVERAAARQGDRRAALALARRAPRAARASTARRSCSAASTTTSPGRTFPLEIFSTEYRLSRSSSACRAASTPRSPRCCSSAQGYEVVGLFMKNWEDDDDDEYCSSREDLIDAASGGRRDRHRARGTSTSPPSTRTACSPSSCASTRPAARPTPTCCATPRSSSRPSSTTRCAWAPRRSRPATTPGCASATAASSCSRGCDAAKDQSYFLHRLNQAQLSRDAVPGRRAAEDRGAPHRARDRACRTHAKKDSTGICFIGERPFREFLNRYLPKAPGPIEDDRRPDASASTSGSPSTRSASARASASAAWRTRGRSLVRRRKDSASNELIVVQGHDHPLL